MVFPQERGTFDDGEAFRFERVPLGNQIADVIRRDILYGRLPAGTHVGQQLLCERFNTSRMPVRDALRQLTTQGFLVDDGHGHSLVAPLTRSDLRDIYLIEGMLHGLALRRITERHAEDEISELAGYHDEMLRATEAGDSTRMSKINWQFHRRINQLSRSPKLLAVIRTHSLSIPNDQVDQMPNRSERVNREHAEIMAAVRRREGAAAESLMRQHVVNAGEDLLRFLEAQHVEFA
ncbi:MAG: GntR family transcriptional regulator [Actinobacteria bacterium]|nr:GntR family transcriptional regulator [Actinomycetota bacterium]